VGEEESGEEGMLVGADEAWAAAAKEAIDSDLRSDNFIGLGEVVADAGEGEEEAGGGAEDGVVGVVAAAAAAAVVVVVFIEPPEPRLGSLTFTLKPEFNDVEDREEGKRVGDEEGLE